MSAKNKLSMGYNRLLIYAKIRYGSRNRKYQPRGKTTTRYVVMLFIII